jgi:hypothetical protein
MSVTVFSQLDKSLHEHLAAVAQLAARGDDHSVAELARAELPRIIAAVKALLDEHQPDENGRCSTCRTRWWSRRLPSPCRAYLSAQLSLTVAGEQSPGGGAHRHLRRVG